MKSRFVIFGLSLFLFSGFAFAACSSGDDSPSNNDTGGSNGTNSGVVPENTDSGKNNNSEPDNTVPENSKPEVTPGGETGGDSSDNTGGGQPTSWKLIFEDNFEGTDSIPNTEYWSLAKRGSDTWNRYMSESYGQSYQKDGYLYLFGMESDGEYLTGGIESINKFEFTYGQVKCRARFLREPQGNHTGIWMMPSPPAQKWPKSGEIDIMEHLDDQSKVFETVHFWNSSTEEDDKSDTSTTVDNSDFNVYGVIWDNESVSFTLNGDVVFSYSNDDPGNDEFSYQYPFTKPFYLILSQSLGGKGTWEGVIDNKELPAVFQIDWIKVWQKE